MQDGPPKSNLYYANVEKIPKSEAEKIAESRLTPENVLRVYNQSLMGDGECSNWVPMHARFGRKIFSQNKLYSLDILETIEQFAKQLPDDFLSEFGADSSMAKNIKDSSVKEGYRPWTTSDNDITMLLSVIEAVKLGKVVTGLGYDKYAPPKERGDFLFKIQWDVYESNKAQRKDVYGDTKFY